MYRGGGGAGSGYIFAFLLALQAYNNPVIRAIYTMGNHFFKQCINSGFNSPGFGSMIKRYKCRLRL
jgi:hypothetical protein